MPPRRGESANNAQQLEADEVGEAASLQRIDCGGSTRFLGEVQQGKMIIVLM